MAHPPAALPAPAPDPAALALELGLTAEEYARIVAILGRAPSTAELGSYSVMWSEHCSYKSSKVHLRRLPTDGPHVLVGPGENAGVVDVGDGVAVTFKIESHNHPSYVEPFQGAATGVGGIIRDILTMGARPIALLDPLRFGDPAEPVTRRIVDGVVRGIGHYGNSIGVPTVGGEVSFDACYGGNPLVNVLCVGAMPIDGIQLARAERPGDIAVLIGQRTGRDGIGGASVLASAEFAEGGVDDAKRPNVQVGDPFAGKLLIETCLELYERGLLSGIQDMGAAGIACSTSEMAAAARLGMRVDLDRVPLREPDLQAWEILCSESQERMLALVRPDRLADVLEVCARWGVDATPVGEVIEGRDLEMTRGGELVLRAPAASLADEGPTYHRPIAPWQPPDPDAAPLDPPEDLSAALHAVLTDPDVAPPRWVHEQYDAIVGSGTLQGPGASAAVLRLPADLTGGSPRGVAVATDGNGRWGALDPREGARRAVAEAARNVAATGARPIAATNNLNFGSPEVPEVMGAFSDTIDGLAEACVALGTPITGGNVSFYNQTGQRPIHPTPVVGVLGVVDDVTRTIGTAWRAPGDVVVLLGVDAPPELAGSVYERAVAGRLAGRLTPLDLEAEAALQGLLIDAVAAGELSSAHDVADGGLIATLVESCADLGATLEVDLDVPPHAWLCSEAPGRVVVSLAPAALDAVTARAADAGLVAEVLGRVTDAARLRIAGIVDLDLAELDAARGRALADALGV